MNLTMKNSLFENDVLFASLVSSNESSSLGEGHDYQHSVGLCCPVCPHEDAS